MWIILAFVVGIILGIFLEWSAWTRCRRQHTKVGTPSASHNRQSNVIMPHCKTCSGFDKVSLVRCYQCKGSKWSPA
jgi:hypothetical protein